MPPPTKRGSIFGTFLKNKPSAKSQSKVNSQRRKSFQPTSYTENVGSISIMDHITGAEDIYETELFSTGDQLTLIRNNLEWESKLLRTPPQPENGFEGTERTISISVGKFLAYWDATLEDRDIARQFLAILKGGNTPDKELGPLEISSDSCDDLFSSLKLSVPFLPCLWTTRRIYGTRRFQYSLKDSQCEAIDIWYTVPLSIMVNGEGNFSLASSAIYSRYLSLSPQVSLILIVLRYNWEKNSLRSRPIKDFETILDEFKIGQNMDFERRRAKNGCEWHLAPQVAYFGMVLKLWREGLESLDTFTHEQERKMYSDLSNDRQPTTISIRSVHLRLKYLHEEIEGLQSICQTLESLFGFWREMAEKGGDEFDTARASAVHDLILLKDEFKSQISSRDELVKRLSNIQNLYFNLTTAKIAQESKYDSTAMKTIAIVTTIFFPATFVATFMSMTFFQFGHGSITVSHSIWIYFIITIPLTVLILGGTMYWLRKRKKQEKKIDEEDGEKGVDTSKMKLKNG